MPDPARPPANVTIQLTRLRDGSWRATAQATDWPERRTLSAAVTSALVAELVLKVPNEHVHIDWAQFLTTPIGPP